MALINSDKIKFNLERIETEIQKWLEPTLSPGAPYQVSTEFEADRFQFETSDQEEFYILLFSRLANYFEKGFLMESLLEHDLPSWSCALYFTEGRIALADPPLKAEMPLPSPGPHRVFKANPSQWRLKTPEWKNLIPQQERWTALVFEIAPQIRFLFYTQLAEPWLKVQTENAHKFIERALSVLP